MQWVIKHGGLATEESYGRYLAQVKQKPNRAFIKRSVWDLGKGLGTNCMKKFGTKLFAVKKKHILEGGGGGVKSRNGEMALRLA